MSVPNFEEINFQDSPNCAIFGAIAGSLGTLVILLIVFCIYERLLRWRDRCQKRRRIKRRKQSAPPEKAVSPGMSGQNSEGIYQDITTAAGKPAEILYYQNLSELPPPVPALYSNMTFSTISQESQWLPEQGFQESDVAPTNIIPPYISRYDSLVTWLKSMYTGVQE